MISFRVYGARRDLQVFPIMLIFRSDASFNGIKGVRSFKWLLHRRPEVKIDKNTFPLDARIRFASGILFRAGYHSLCNISYSWLNVPVHLFALTEVRARNRNFIAVGSLLFMYIFLLYIYISFLRFTPILMIIRKPSRRSF